MKLIDAWEKNELNRERERHTHTKNKRLTYWEQPFIANVDRTVRVEHYHAKFSFFAFLLKSGRG